MISRYYSGKNRIVVFASNLSVFIFVSLLYCTGLWAEVPEKVSGDLINGFRVLKAGNLVQGYAFSVFRGDYIKFNLEGGEAVTFSIPALDIKSTLEKEPVSYFKMKQVGTFEMFIGDAAGTIRVIEYKEAHYHAVSAKEAQEVIRTFAPLILDVRTPKEYKRARLAGATLLPVQVMQHRWTELAAHKDEPILIYCATGNRSTVAAKILIDKGFTRIFNLRHGIADWYRKKYPIIQ